MLLDLISLIILVVFIIIGFKKGFIKSVMGLATVILSLVIAMNFWVYPANYINDNFIEPHFTNKTSDSISALMNGGTEVIPPEKIFADKPEALQSIADKFNIDVELIEEYYETTVKNVTNSFNIDEISEKLSEFIVESLSRTVSNILGFAALFFASIIVLWMVFKLISLIFKLPVLKFTNKLAGSLLGVIKSLILIVVVTNILFNLAVITGNNNEDATAIQHIWSESAITESVSYSAVNSVGLIFKVV